MKDLKEKLPKLPFWNCLSDNEKEMVLSSARERMFEKREILENCDDSCLGLIYVSSGCLRVAILSDEGREITLFKLQDGEICILSASCVLKHIVFETEIVAKEKTDTIIIDSVTISELLDNNINFKCFCYEKAIDRFSTAMWVLQDIVCSGLDKRLSKFLVDMVEESGSNEIQMTQDEIASEVNSSREVVTRMLKQFTIEELIEVNRKKIIVKDINGLKMIAK